VPTDMTDEVDANSARPFIVKVAVQAEWAQVTLEFAAEEGGGLTTSGVAGLLGAEKNEV